MCISVDESLPRVTVVQYYMLIHPCKDNGDILKNYMEISSYAVMSELTPKGTIKGSFTLISICCMAFAAELVDATI